MVRMATSPEEAAADYRQYLADLSTESFQRMRYQNAYVRAKYFIDNHSPPWLFELTELWTSLYKEPFKGVTADGW